jgi:hypothetical protein
MSSQPQDQMPDEPRSVLDYIRTPAYDVPIRVGEADPAGIAAGRNVEVAEIIRMRSGKPNETGFDVRLVLSDGTHHDIGNTPIEIVYKPDPMATALRDEELRRLVQMTWTAEKGTKFDLRGHRQFDELRERSIRHGQDVAVHQAVSRLRVDRERMEADERVRSLAGGNLPIEDEPVLAAPSLDL